jgi:DNA-binding response OmpR family regulator
VSSSIHSLSGQRILVVDDHEDWLEIADTVLTFAGAEVTTCASPEAAVALLASSAFTVVLTDLGFGNDPMEGVRVLQAARRQAWLYVIALTGRKEAAQELRRLGFDAVFVKPMDPFELVTAIAREVRENGGGRPSSPTP